MQTAENKTMNRFNSVFGEIDAVYHEASLKLGLSDSVSKILYTICNFGDNCPLHTVCLQTGLSKQTVNSSVRLLEKQGYVYLLSAGKKTKDIFLTEQGKAYSAATAQKILWIENEILSEWTQEEVDIYFSLTKRFLMQLKAKVSKL